MSCVSVCGFDGKVSDVHLHLSGKRRFGEVCCIPSEQVVGSTDEHHWPLPSGEEKERDVPSDKRGMIADC